jgi:hypothetical protein
MSPRQLVLTSLLSIIPLACVVGDGEFGSTGGTGGGSSGTGAYIEEPAPVREPVSPRLPEVLAPPAVNAEDDAEPPLGHRVARKTIVVLAEPRWGAAMRGRIDMGNAFAIHEPVEGKGCTGEGWARVDAMGYVCLRDAVVSKRAGKPLPPVAADRVVPFTYAKLPDGGGLTVPRYRSAAALARGDAPLDFLQAHHQYSFVETRRVAGVGLVLLDRSRRAVPAAGLEVARASGFAGRELSRRPIADGAIAAWSAEAPTPVRAAPGLAAAPIGRIEYHREIDLEPAPVRADGIDWYRLRGESGWVSDEDIRRWIPGEPLADVRADEVWLDVELAEQTLTVRRGDEPLLVTLISSGAGHNPTPRGVFRIWHKQALGTMRSLPGDADSYAVEDVPWVQYFHRRFALHTAFWHNKFGRKRSHGCINLAPRDAAQIFGQTSPPVPPGWTFVYEHEDAPGTTVRIRKGNAPVPDRRREIGDADEAPAGDDVVVDDDEADAADDAAAP